MLKNKKKASVYTLISPSDKGFTIVSLIMSITIIGTTLMLIPTLYHLIEQDSRTSEYSIRQFFHFLSDEINRNQFDYVEDNTIHLTNESDKKITLSLYQDIIRRQVNGNGHEIFVRQIDEFKVTELSYGLHVSIIATTGDSYAKTISFY